MQKVLMVDDDEDIRKVFHDILVQVGFEVVLGADDYLFKPIDSKVLIARIRSLLKTASRRRPI